MCVCVFICWWFLIEEIVSNLSNVKSLYIYIYVYIKILHYICVCVCVCVFICWWFLIEEIVSNFIFKPVIIKTHLFVGEGFNGVNAKACDCGLNVNDFELQSR